jgi:hypothetical protein
MPACLPEQFIAIGDFAVPVRIASTRARSSSGQSGGVWSNDSSSPDIARIRRTPSMWKDSPECDAHTSASSSPSRSSPARNMPTAWSGLLALRGYIGAKSAPTEWARLPSGFVITTRPRCTLSTNPLRTTSTRIGSVSNGLVTF